MKRIITSILAVLIYSSLITAQTGDVKVDTIEIQLSDISIHSVLTQPADVDNIPIALIIAGSGPTDLNGNQPGVQNNCLKYLSDALVKNQIATLRFDKRGIANSAYPEFSESDLTIDQYAKDVQSIIKYLSTQGFSDIYVVGHSEGSLIGLIALQELKVKGFISIAGVGNSADIILKEQLKPQLPQDFYHSVEGIIDSLKNGYEVKDVPSQLYMLFRPSVQPYLISWFKHNPAELIGNMNTHALIVQGNKDLNVNVKEAKLLVDASINADYVEIENMNHVLKSIEGDIQENMASYRNPDLAINQKLVNTLIQFINK